MTPPTSSKDDSPTRQHRNSPSPEDGNSITLVDALREAHSHNRLVADSSGSSLSSTLRNSLSDLNFNEDSFSSLDTTASMQELNQLRGPSFLVRVLEMACDVAGDEDLFANAQSPPGGYATSNNTNNRTRRNNHQDNHRSQFDQ